MEDFFSRDNASCGICEVWKSNLHEQFKAIRARVQSCRYVAMDTEFPGFIVKRTGRGYPSEECPNPDKFNANYYSLQTNVNLLHIIQIGLSFFDEQGNQPKGVISTWQFNFKFDLTQDLHAVSSINLLQDAGIDFEKLETDGIDPSDFAELLIPSGLVLMPNIQWLSFNSRYDFGYLLRLLMAQNLPADAAEFFNILKLYFPNVYDLKELTSVLNHMHGGLKEIATQVNLRWIGQPHQAGSDALMTGLIFFRLRDTFFYGVIHKKYSNSIHALTNPMPPTDPGDLTATTGEQIGPHILLHTVPQQVQPVEPCVDQAVAQVIDNVD